MNEFGSQWMQRWQGCVNGDAVMKNVGRYFDENVHGRLKIEGDVKVVWQNLRAFTWALALMRDVAH
jgi:hypothetical protein